MPKFKIFIFIVIAVIIFFAGRVLYKVHQQMSPAPAPIADTPFVYTPPDNRERIPQPSRAFVLADSTRVFLIDTSVMTPVEGFGKTRREIKVDGDMFFESPASAKPLVVRTRLLELTVKGKAAFRVIAYNKEDGEEVQVISGDIHVKKAYKSQFDEPEDLGPNQMVMINITIDLMEKEKFDAKDLKAWRDTVRISPVPKQPL